MKFKWKILHISDVQIVGAEWHHKKDIVLEEIDVEYPNSIYLTVFGRDKIWMIDPYSVGDVLSILYNVKAVKYKGKRFSNNTIWRINKPNDKKETSAESAIDWEEGLPF